MARCWFDRTAMSHGAAVQAHRIRWRCCAQHSIAYSAGCPQSREDECRTASPPDISSCACELRALGIGVLCEREQLAVIHRGLVTIAGSLCGARGAIVSAEAVRLALLRCFVLLER